MKKLLAFALAFVLVVALAACGGTEEESSSVATSSITSSSAVSTVSTVSADDPTTEKNLLMDLGDVTVYVIDDKIFNEGEKVVYRHDDGDMYNITVSYTADADITQFRVLDFDASEALCISGVDAEIGDLSKGESAYSKQYVNDATASTGFSYVNAMGETEYYYFSCDMSGNSGFAIRSYLPDDPSTGKNLLGDSGVDLGDVTVYVIDDEIFNEGEKVVYRHDDGDMYNITVSYTADADITQFRVLNFDASEALCISGVDAEIGDLSKGESVYSKQYVNDATISTGFSYVNAMGETEYYYFSCSMSGDSGFCIRSYEIN